MADITTEYKGEEIKFTEWNESWTWENYSNTSLKKVKEYIDRSQKEDFERVTAIKSNHWTDSEYGKVLVTSRTDTGEYWIKNSKGRREKVRAEYLYADSEENMKVIAEMRELHSKAKAIGQEISTKVKSLKPFSVPTKSASGD